MYDFDSKEWTAIKKISVRIEYVCSDISKLCVSCSRCCCGTCAGYQGYFNRSLPEQLTYLKTTYKFDKIKGFHTATGCSLPRHLRSKTCLGYCCIPELKVKLSLLAEAMGYIKNAFGIIH